MKRSLFRASVLATAAIAMPSVSHSQARGLDQLQWLVGCWERAMTNNRRGIERWDAPRGGSMIGVSLVLTDTITRESEQLRLFALGDTLVYEAHPSSQARAEFKVVPSSATEFVFANPEHDFPQRIIYRRVGSDSLVARIEGDQAGRQRPIDYPFKRVPCGAMGESSGAHARAMFQARYDSLTQLESQTLGSRNAWFADHAGAGYALTVWSSPGSTVASFDASALRRMSGGQVTAFRNLRPTAVRYRATVERVRQRGDTAEVLVAANLVYTTVDSAGRMGPAGQSHVRASETKWLDTWIREGAQFRLRRTDIISEELSTDGKLTIRDGKSVSRP